MLISLGFCKTYDTGKVALLDQANTDFMEEHLLGISFILFLVVYRFDN